MTIHNFYMMARFRIGKEVVEVYAAESVLVDKRIGELRDVDTAVVTLRSSSRASASSKTLAARPAARPAGKVFGEKDMLRADNPRLDTVVRADADGDRST